MNSVIIESICWMIDEGCNIQNDSLYGWSPKITFPFDRALQGQDVGYTSTENQVAFYISTYMIGYEHNQIAMQKIRKQESTMQVPSGDYQVAFYISTR